MSWVKYNIRSLYRRTIKLEAASIVSVDYINEVNYGGRRISINQLGGVYTGSNIEFELKPYEIDYPVIGLLYIDMNRDALVYLDKKPYIGLDRFHKWVVIDDPLEKHLVSIKPYLTHTFGEASDGMRINRIVYLVVLENSWRLAQTLKYVLEAIEEINDESIASELIDIVAEALNSVEVESYSIDSLGVIIDVVEPSLRTFRELVDNLRILIAKQRDLLREAGFRPPDYRAIEDLSRRALENLWNRLRSITSKYWKEGALYAVSHAHIDVAWLWGWDETVGKVARTAVNTLYILDRYEEPVFVFGSALYYYWLKKYYPEIHDRVREYIAKGRWEIIGGTWVEADTILTPLESTIRQFYYGQKFFMEEYGVKASIAWMPDSFGFNPILPQIMKQSGIKYFATHKLCWNKYNKFPYHVFLWRGLDGTEIPSQMIIGGYGVDINPRIVKRIWTEYNAKNIIPKTLLVYGFGDGGGGPTIDHVEKLRVYNNLPIYPRIEHGRLEDYVKELVEKLGEQRKPLKWFGELYLELHRGTYTTNFRIKHLVYKADYFLRVYETLSSLLKWGYGIECPVEEIDRYWRKLLLAEFHDILPGSSIYSVYEQTYRMLDELIDSVYKEILGKLFEASELSGIGLPAVYNQLPWERIEYIELDENMLEALDSIPYQNLGDGKILIRTRLPPLSISSICSIVEGPIDDRIYIDALGDSIVIRNKHYIARINRRGEIESLIDRETGRELVSRPSNIIVAYEDIPHEWDAWEIDEDYDRKFWIINSETKPEIIEDGPYRVRIRYRWRFRESTIVLDIIGYADKKEIVFRIRFDWKERNILVKTWFYPRINSDQALYDMGAGYIARPTHRNTSWEKAKFEVYKHKWVALRDDEHLFAVISHERNGVAVEYSDIGLSLIKAPVYPNPLSDYGVIDTYYAIWFGPAQSINDLYRVSYEIAYKPIIVPGSKSGKHVSKSFIEVNGAIMENVKLCSDETGCIVVRLYNPLNKYVKASIKLWRKPREAFKTNILEEERYRDDVVLKGYEVKVDLRPFEIASIMIF